MTAKELLHRAVDGFSEAEAAELLALVDRSRAVDGESMTQTLNGIDGARERAEHGLKQALAGETVSLDDLARGSR